MLQKLWNRAADLALGIRTMGIVGTNIPDGCHASTVDYSTIRQVLDKLDLKPEDVFIDIGCGRGRVVCLAARRRLRDVIGIDLSPDMAALTSDNLLMRLRGRKSEGSASQYDATQYDYSEITVAYFFNPFEAHILDRVLTKIYNDRNGRPFRCAFVNLSPAQATVFLGHNWLSCVDQWAKNGMPVAIYASSRRSSVTVR